MNITDETRALASERLVHTVQCAVNASTPELSRYWADQHDEIHNAISTNDENAVRRALDLPEYTPEEMLDFFGVTCDPADPASVYLTYLTRKDLIDLERAS